MAIGGDTKAIYRERSTNSEDQPAKEKRTPLRKAETLLGTRTRRRVSESTNSAGDKERSSTGDQTLHRGTESTPMSRDTKRVDCLGNL